MIFGSVYSLSQHIHFSTVRSINLFFLCHFLFLPMVAIVMVTSIVPCSVAVFIMVVPVACLVTSNITTWCDLTSIITTESLGRNVVVAAHRRSAAHHWQTANGDDRRRTATSRTANDDSADTHVAVLRHDAIPGHRNDTAAGSAHAVHQHLQQTGWETAVIVLDRG